MKFCLTNLLLLLFLTKPFCQKTEDQKLFDRWHESALREGDKMPDIALGTVINNRTGKTRFSQFRGKIIILDFWSTTCTGCLAEMAYMENLQRQFKNRIQIFLVNPFE